MPKPSETLSQPKRVTKKDGRTCGDDGAEEGISAGELLYVLEDSGFKVVAFVDEDAVNCYIAVLTI